MKYVETANVPQKDETNKSRFIPAARWNDYHPWPPQGGLRYLIFHEKTNGFSQCVVRVGRTVLIDEQAFLEWMRSKKGGAVR